MKKYAFIFVNTLCLFSLFIHAKDKQISKFGEQSICDILENIENKKIKQSVEAFISKDSILANIISESKNEQEILFLIKILTKDYDADVNAKNNYGQTALHVAVAKGYAKIVQELLHLSADINIKNLEGKTPLMVAENSDIVELLINNGATIPSNYVYPIFLLAIAENNIKIVKFLLSKKVDVNKQDFNNTPLLMYAASAGNTQIINLLLEHGAIIDARNDDGETALMWAAYQNKVEATELLLEKKANINIQDHNDNTALMEASYKASPQLLKILLENDLQINKQNKQGNTTLMIASGNANLEAVKFLLDNKATRTLKNNSNQTAKDITKEQIKNLKDLKNIENYIEIFDLLTQPISVNCK